MTTLLKKEDQTGIIVVISVAALAAGAAAYLLLTQHGKNYTMAIKHKIKDEAKDIASGIISKKTGISKRTVKKVADHLAK